MAGEDFVQVQMSAAGVAYAGKDGVIAVQNSRSHFHFKAGESQKVVKSYEWGYLATLQHEGEPMFEIVATGAAQPVTNAQPELHQDPDQEHN